MALEDRKYWSGTAAEAQAEFDAGLRKYMLGVYNYMASGVALTGIVAWLVAFFEPVRGIFYSVNAQGVMAPNMLMWITMFASIGLVFFLSFRVGHIKAATAQAVFWAYAGLNGVWLSAIFETYTAVSIARVFFITTAAFAGLSLYGYTTKRDLSPMRAFLVMGLIGILIAMVVNIFLASSMLHFVISAAGVLIFSGLTAYDTQKIKEIYAESDGSEIAAKKSIMGALTLYLDFINLFIMLLRLFGQRE